MSEVGGITDTPVDNTMPPEIFTEVFLALRDSSKYTTSTQWLTVTWVCRLWREMALSSPLLWAKIHMRRRWPPEMVCAFIELSSGVGLDVNFDIGPLPSYISSSLYAHANHIKSLCFRFWELESTAAQTQELVDRFGRKLASLSLANDGIDVDMFLRSPFSSLRSLCMASPRVVFGQHHPVS
ncbi:hypothetical protein K466DRAFT_595809 [Polyporus arcularius HHB13444]|uniref:F-box domain-containing protein n=1 Tax=Polyporus arcularius HHB13444 TaxID=1314778 RepID=A0A5C3PT42_9APHY|nr:hypothetical protein K466DRAFT_595809 [Polyporus arcularius HHB13444]